MVLQGRLKLDGFQSLFHNQQHLGKVISSLFPGKHIITNSRKGVHIPSPDTGFYLELDFWIPSLNLAFEYQDPHHYVTSWYSYRSVQSTQKRDDIKVKIAKEKGVSLVVVPCWWDGRLESLVASIHQIRPEIHPTFDKKGSPPISEEIPDNFFVVHSIPDVGEVTLASLPENIAFDPINWWVSEKYDGIRACFHPVQKVLYSRFGKKYSIPDTLLNQFPPHFVDGEIWFGRESHLEAQQLHVKVGPEKPQGVPRKSNEEEEADDETTLVNESVSWPFMRVTAMDLADPSLKSLEYEKRFAILLESLDSSLPTLTIAMSFRCRSKKALHENLQQVLDGGGEGIILREPKSIYFNGRSDTLKKYKISRDQEGLVLVVDGAEVTLKLVDSNIITAKLVPDERRLFEITSDKVPKVGEIVTFKYNKLSSYGLPWHSTVDRIRKDLLWEDVLRSYKLQETRKRSADDCFELHGKGRTARGFWMDNDAKNGRLFFDNFAKRKGLDPLLPETWYKLSYKDLINLKGWSMLRYFGGSLKQTLVTLYPNIGLDVTKFDRVTNNYWADFANRRKFMENLAKLKGFDPLSASHWYGISVKSLFTLKGGASIYAYYNGSIIAALRDLFPNMIVDESKFVGPRESNWRFQENRRKFMDEFAMSNGFDPLIPDNWYGLRAEDIIKAQGASLMVYFQNSIPKLVLAVYPNIGLDEGKFRLMRKGYWNDANVKRFFDDYAKSNDFDPLVSENWYSTNANHIKSLKGGQSVVTSSLCNALLRAYPNIGINPKLFTKMSSYWRNRENRKKFLADFAHSRGAVPVDDQFWSAITSDDIFLHRGGRAVLSFYGYSLKHALADLYPNISLSNLSNSATTKNYWHDMTNQRRVFDQVAKRHGFDPLVADNWYSFPKIILKNEKGVRSVIEFYHKSIRPALIANYPELNLQADKFVTETVVHWRNKENRKILLKHFALARNFDPLVSSAWAPYLHEHQKELHPVTRFYSGSLLTALADLFPVKS